MHWRGKISSRERDMVAGPIYRGSYGNMAGGCLPRGGVAASVTDPHSLMRNRNQIECRNLWTSRGGSNLWNCLPDWFSGLNGSIHRSKNRIPPPPCIIFFPHTQYTKIYSLCTFYCFLFAPSGFILSIQFQFFPLTFVFPPFLLSSFPFHIFPPNKISWYSQPPPPGERGKYFQFYTPAGPITSLFFRVEINWEIYNTGTYIQKRFLICWESKPIDAVLDTNALTKSPVYFTASQLGSKQL